MDDWQWVQEIDRQIEESEFVQANSRGAKVGEYVGGTAGVIAVAGVVYAGTAAAAAAGGAATGTTGAAGAAAASKAYKAGYWTGRKTAKFVVEQAAKGAWSVGRIGGSYAGACAQAGARKIADLLTRM